MGTNGTGAVIDGTAGDDRLCGTTGSDTIRGGGGNDIIIGGTGDDVIYGDDGNDNIVAGAGHDTIYGGSGSDTINGDYPEFYYQPYSGQTVVRPSADDAADTIFAGSGADTSDGEEGDDFIDAGDSAGTPGAPLSASSIELAYGRAGDDVIIGSGPTWANTFFGGAGNDILYPYPFRVVSNSVTGDDGSDVAVLANMARLMQPDLADLDGAPEIGISSACTVVDPLTSGEDQGSMKCDLPWPSQLSGLNEILTVTANVDQSGNVTWGGDLYDGLAEIQVDSWRQLAHGAGITSDVCLCDPLVQVGALPPSGYYGPYDYKG
jgi:hypothetical protein